MQSIATRAAESTTNRSLIYTWLIKKGKSNGIRPDNADNNLGCNCQKPKMTYPMLKKTKPNIRKAIWDSSKYMVSVPMNTYQIGKRIIQKITYWVINSFNAAINIPIPVCC